MSQIERRAMEAANRVWNKALANMAWADAPEGTEHIARLPNGRRIFLKGSQRHSYRYFESSDGWQFCYTCWKDENGDYWSWVYKPVGKGARSGDPERFKMIKLLSARKRKIALARAERMLNRREQMVTGNS